MSYTVTVWLCSILGAFLVFGKTDGADYIIPALGGGNIYAATGKAPGGWQVKTFISPLSQNIHSFNETGSRRRNFNIRLYDTGVNLYGGGSNDIFYSPLPSSALGNRYLFSSCEPNSDDYTSVLMIATHTRTADVDITFKLDGNVTYDGKTYYDGDTLSVSLQEHQTWSINSSFDLTGTVITSTGSAVAVFSKMLYKKSLASFEQLPPIKHFGKGYVVTVDNNRGLYQLQIISEHSDTQIMFAKGSSISIVSVNESRVYRQSLLRSESLDFTTTRPVMTTLCRVNRRSSGFMVVPPVTGYKKEFALSQLDNMRIITEIGNRDVAVTVAASPTLSISWTSMPSGNFHIGHIGKLRSNPLVDDKSAYITANFNFTILFPSVFGIYSGGYSFSYQSNMEIEKSGENYLIPSGDIETVYTAAGERGSWWTVQSQIPPYSVDSHKVAWSLSSFPSSPFNVFQLNDVDSTTTIIGNLHYTKFSLLPISSLGTKYIVSYCAHAGSQLLVIATHSQATDVDITFRLKGNYLYYEGITYGDGDTLSLSFSAYTTHKIVGYAPLIGTVVSSKNASVAVFTGTGYNIAVYELEQLLPVQHYGKEYVVAVPNKRSQMQVVSEYNDTEIMFNNGSTEIVGETGVYLGVLEKNESLYFNTTKPVMTTLCTGEGFVVVPPVSSYIRETVIIEPIIDSDKDPRVIVIKILMGNDALPLHFNQSEATVEWEEVANSRFKVGTLNLHPLWFHTSIRSDSRFSVMVYRSKNVYAYNGGYDFSSDDMATTQPVLITTQPATAGAEGHRPKRIYLLLLLLTRILR